MNLVERLKKMRIYNYWLAHALMFAIGVIVIATRSPIAIAIGTSVVATAIAGIVLYLYVQFHYDDLSRQEHLRAFGFEDAFEYRSVAIKKEYDSRLQRAEQNIDIMGFGLKHLREDYGDEFLTWASRAKVRILIIDPDSPSAQASYAAQRSIEEQDAQDSIRTSVLAFLAATQQIRRNSAGAFQVRLFRCLPSINIFRIDNAMFWGPYLIREQSRNTPTFLIKRDGALFDRYLKHFDTIWRDGELSREPE